MRPITVVRFWYGMSGFFVVALVANLVVVLRQPIFSWRDAIPLRLFFFYLSFAVLVGESASQVKG